MAHFPPFRILCTSPTTDRTRYKNDSPIYFVANSFYSKILIYCTKMLSKLRVNTSLSKIKNYSWYSGLLIPRFGATDITEKFHHAHMSFLRPGEPLTCTLK